MPQSKIAALRRHQEEEQKNVNEDIQIDGQQSDQLSLSLTSPEVVEVSYETEQT